MIAFQNAHLAPPEMCRLIWQIVPEEFHLPVIFRCDRLPDEMRHPVTRRLPLGTCDFRRVEVYLNPIWTSAMWDPGSRPAAVWLALLDVVFHEFGHVATAADAESVEIARRASSLSDPSGRGSVLIAVDTRRNRPLGVPSRNSRNLRERTRLVQPPRWRLRHRGTAGS